MYVRHSSPTSMKLPFRPQTLEIYVNIKQVGIAQSVQRTVTGRAVRGSNPIGGEFSGPVQTGPGVHQPPIQWVSPGGNAAGAWS